MYADAGKKEETLQEFCAAVWQKVAERLNGMGQEALLSDQMTRMNALYSASHLWSGEHDECKRRGLENAVPIGNDGNSTPIRDRGDAAAIVVQDVLREAAKYETAETAED
ncbi:MAG: hypothetical protein HW405_275 [Candidatus Berkelbacteria bacterium]|nr:hypothetical protein [Candidatus Berkelbacteria bacterium]